MLVYIFNFNLFECLATNLEKGLLTRSCQKVKISLPLRHNIYGFVYYKYMYNWNVYPPPKIQDLKYLLTWLWSLRTSRNTSPFQGFALPYLAVTAFFVMLLTTSQCSVFDRLISCDPDVSNSFGYVWFKLTCRLFQLHSQSLHAKLNLLVFQTATSNDSVNYYIYSADRNECQWKNSQKFIYILVLCMLQHLFR